MKLCIWFRTFDRNILIELLPMLTYTLQVRNLVSNLSTPFIGFIKNFEDFLLMIRTCACGFRILIRFFLLELLPMLT